MDSKSGLGFSCLSTHVAYFKALKERTLQPVSAHLFMSRYSESGIPSEDPRAQKTRQKLKQALIEVMAGKEFTKISVNDLTTAANVNRATFYSHYEDKQGLLDAIIAETFQQMMAAYKSADVKLDDDSLQEFVKSVWEYVGFFSSSIGGAAGDNFTSLIQGELVRQIEEIITVWLSEQLSDKSALGIMSGAIAGSIFQTAAIWSKNPDAKKTDEVSKLVRNLLIHGLKHSRFSERDTLT